MFQFCLPELSCVVKDYFESQRRQPWKMHFWDQNIPLSYSHNQWNEHYFYRNSIDFAINKIISATNCYQVSHVPLIVLSLRATSSKEALHNNETSVNWVCPNWHKYYSHGHYFTEQVPRIFWLIYMYKILLLHVF